MSTPAESLTVGRSAAEQIEKGLTTALTFDDVLLVPAALARAAERRRRLFALHPQRPR